MKLSRQLKNRQDFNGAYQKERRQYPGARKAERVLSAAVVIKVPNGFTPRMHHYS
jgi:hypothetical protein